jgi:cytochrome c553
MNKQLAAQCRPIKVGLQCVLLSAIAWIAWIPWATNSGAIAQPLIPDTIAQRTIACTACHGKEGRATSAGFFPRIAGKPAGYLYNQLVNFRDGRRQSQMMTYLVGHLSDAYLMEMADYFSSLELAYPAPQVLAVSKARLDRGQALVLSGDRSKNVPACTACHGKNLTGVAPAIPGLVGLPHDYLNAQFGAWRVGTRKAAVPDCMAQVVARLSPEDINAVTAWLASQSVVVDGRPATALPGQLPMPCGSWPQQ